MSYFQNGANSDALSRMGEEADRAGEVGMTESRLVRPFDARKAHRERAEILIVDDERDFTDMLESVLKDYDIITAHNGEMALSLFKQRSPDLVLTDIVMPKMNGAELIKELAKYANTPVIAFSGYVLDIGSYEHFVVHEATTKFLEKPFSFDELVETVRRTMAGLRS